MSPLSSLRLLLNPRRRSGTRYGTDALEIDVQYTSSGDKRQSVQGKILPCKETVDSNVTQAPFILARFRLKFVLLIDLSDFVPPLLKGEGFNYAQLAKKPCTQTS